jgi:hypothetical protein
MGYTDFTVNSNARKPTAGPTGNLKGQGFDKSKKGGASNNTTGSALPTGIGGKGGKKGGK